ncbi:alpha/beta hydrolase [Flavobacteriaceae bacterium GSB9]|nr:alpha/beta hydrolase [Flavobacteriaceae bacterium GSB9]
MGKIIIKTIGKSINFLSYLLPSYAAKLAVKIFSTPQKGRLTNEENEYLKSAKQQSIQYNDFVLSTYHWKGKNATILLAHGWESNSFRWKNLIELLKTKHYNIVSIDAPAHGNSGSKIFNAVLYSECINLVAKQHNANIIIGHSIGGTSSVLAANKYKLPIEKLILLGAPSNFDEVITNYVNMMGYNKRVVKAMDKYYLKHFGYLPEHYTVENFSSNLKADGLIIHDKKDRIISYKDALQIYKHYDNSKLVKTVGFGHGLKSEKVYQHILDFLED